MHQRNAVLKYLIDECFGGDLLKASEKSGYTVQQLQAWVKGERVPQKFAIKYIIHKLFVPEFKVIVEFEEFDPAGEVRAQLKKMLSGHETSCGIYAFYDGMGNVLYVGKATNLLEECYQTIRRDVPVQFPAGIKKKPEKRYQVIRYVSAYYVGDSNLMDYAKHVESLILRISKPILNKKIGHIEKAFNTPEES